MLDQDLASLYDVPTKRLVQSVKRNLDRFPQDFMFQLTDREFTILKSQIVTSSWGGRRTPPFAFTEQGVAMLSAILKSSRAVKTNIEIVRTFVRLRRLLLSQEDLSRKLLAMEERYDQQFKVVFDAIRQIMTPDILPKQQRIGFRPHECLASTEAQRNAERTRTAGRDAGPPLSTPPPLSDSRRSPYLCAFRARYSKIASRSAPAGGTLPAARSFESMRSTCTFHIVAVRLPGFCAAWQLPQWET